jgi:hypothetical protein
LAASHPGAAGNKEWGRHGWQSRPSWERVPASFPVRGGTISVREQEMLEKSHHQIPSSPTSECHLCPCILLPIGREDATPAVEYSILVPVPGPFLILDLVSHILACSPIPSECCSRGESASPRHLNWGPHSVRLKVTSWVEVHLPKQFYLGHVFIGCTLAPEMLPMNTWLPHFVFQFT